MFNIIYRIVLSAIAVFSLYACGGGGGGGGGENNESYKQLIDVDWQTPCEVSQAGRSQYRSIQFPRKEYDNSQVVDVFINFYKNEACLTSESDEKSSVHIKMRGSITYAGEFATSICVAEKININVFWAEVREIKYVGGKLQSISNEYEGDKLQTILSNISYISPSYNLACVYNGKLFFGKATTELDTTSTVTRPQEMDLLHPYSEWIRPNTY